MKVPSTSQPAPKSVLLVGPRSSVEPSIDADVAVVIFCGSDVTVVEAARAAFSTRVPNVRTAICVVDLETEEGVQIAKLFAQEVFGARASLEAR